MGFDKGGVTFQRFRMSGPKPRQFGDEHLARLREHAAGKPGLATADGIEKAWAAGGHIWDTDFTELKNVYPDHLLWDMRIQTNRLPPDRLKAYYAVELKAITANNRTPFPSARQKREAKDAAKAKLEYEAKDGRYLRWQLVPCLWDLGTNFVFVGSSSSSAADRFATLFETTFGGSLFQDAKGGPLKLLTAGTVAIAQSEHAKHSGLSMFIPGVTPDECEWVPDDAQPDHLGNEFLLWLWYFTEVHEDTLKLDDGTEVTFMFSGGVKLDCPRGQSGDDTMNHEGPARMPEARRAIQTGKLPRKAGLILVRNEEQFGLHIQAETLAVSRCKLPKPADVTAARDIVTARLQSVRDLTETIDQMYAKFLGLRLSGDWSGELAGMQKWLKRAERAAA